ncbi:recombinase family protein [Frankia sp. CNm7]|uniref:Recombinase family protein n=1 Tax=Frankia nepalensis TaxID=1836974 RepID=A0A937RD16_9ACTN|nr:recombinase family protein [Frankia nepalensis]MBL7514452.1 recombinase family protein [Frankia nepalensis]MBL7519007.1 recombinase family protein [Frankia nepalensis]MBL7628027.1 recombinase family protein [Frankia nepalensis]
MHGPAVRAVLFTRQASGSAAEVPGQHAAFTAACAARGWSAGGSVGQIGGGYRAWLSVIGLVQRGRYDVVVVDTWDRLSATEAGKIHVLGLLRRARVRLLIAHEEIDTGDRIGLALVDSLISAGAAVAVAR